MAIEDYLPNVFASSAPSYLQGLLGAEETQKLQGRANVQGLLGAGLALAQGMSRSGPRRSAAENILGALSGGFGAAGGAYDQGIKNYVTQQQIAQTQLAQQDALLKRQQTVAQQGAIEELLKSPEIAGDPLKVAYIRANPGEALKLYSELLPLQGAMQSQPVPQQTTQVAPQQAPVSVQQVPQVQSEPALAITANGQQFVGVPNFAVGEKYVDENRNRQVQQTQQAPTTQDQQLAPISVTAKPSPYNARLAEKQKIEETIRVYSEPRFAGNERAGKIVDQSLKRLEAINKEITKVSVADLSGDLQSFRNSAPPQFQGQIDNLINIAATGEITPDQLSQRTNDISKQINDYNQKEIDFKRKQNDYLQAAYRVGQKVAPGVDPSQYTPEILAKIQAELKAEEKELRIAGRNITTVNVGDKKFAEEFGKGVAAAVQKTYDNALTAQKTLSTIRTIKPLIQEGVYSGPLSSSALAIDRLASSLGFASGTIEDKLVRTTQAMQGLASLELDAATVLQGQGTITDFERKLIAQTAGGNFAQLTAKEVNALLIALEKVANSKISTHNKNLVRLRKRKDTAELADFYELDGGDSLQNDAAEELRRRGQ
jgi:hypothetical protein